MTRTFLPLAFGNAVTAQGDHGMNANAALFAAAWMGLLGERAKQMVCDARLVLCAQAHAEYLHSRTGDQLRQSMHVGSNGSMPNQRVRAAGYALASWYGDGNSVESCARHGGDPGAVARWLADHDGHREHLRGVGWFAGHTFWGVGSHGMDYVALACPGESG